MPSLKSRIACAAVLAVLGVASALPAGPAAAQGVVKKSAGDWQVRCDQAPPGSPKDACAMIQKVTADDHENLELDVIVLKTADGKARVMRVLTSLGVLLTQDLGLKIDGTDIGAARFVRCLPNGCIAEVLLTDELLAKLETGKTAVFIVFQTPEEGIGIPISLSGFKDAFDSLQ